MTNQDVFNMLDTYYTDISTEGFLAYYNVYNALVATELLEFISDTSNQHIFNDYPQYSIDIDIALAVLENNTYFITITRPFDIVIPLF